MRVAERIADALREPSVIGDHELSVTASIGVAIGGGADADATALVRDADAAMYRAKEQGRGRFELFDQAMHARVMRRLGAESELRRAVERGELRLHYQPIVALDGRRADRRRGAGALAASRARAGPAGRCSSRSPRRPA